jgi:hypothetical protein
MLDAVAAGRAAGKRGSGRESAYGAAVSVRKAEIVANNSPGALSAMSGRKRTRLGHTEGLFTLRARHITREIRRQDTGSI